MRRCVGIALTVLSLITTPPVSMAAQTRAPAPSTAAADSALEAGTRAVASQLRCPVCQGLSLQDSPSELAQEMRGVVKEQLRAGRSPSEVKQYFINRYGEWILMEPQRHGFNWLVYALPGLVLAGGLGVIYVAVRRWTAVGGGSPVASLEDEDEDSSDDAGDSVGGVEEYTAPRRGHPVHEG